MGRQNRILVVDDAESARKSLSRLLELAGYDTVEAASGEDALDKISRERIDLTILDVVMPGMGGVETACRIRARSKAIPVVLVSAYASHFFMKHDLPDGVTAYLAKPVEPEDILDAVKRELRHGEGDAERPPRDGNG